MEVKKIFMAKGCFCGQNLACSLPLWNSCSQFVFSFFPLFPTFPVLLHAARYASALQDTVDTHKLFRSRSLREFEETLFCHTKSFPISWDTYWDHNDPLRDVDEAAVPVLCICSADDPVCGPPDHFLPTELFHSNPYFFLLLSHHGGHCGFLRQEPLPAWSHEVILEYFRALTEFFRTEERMKGLSRHRASFLGGRRRWGTLQKREVSPSSNLEEIFSWKRSYTR